jgi:hypothetical protein
MMMKAGDVVEKHLRKAQETLILMNEDKRYIRDRINFARYIMSSVKNQLNKNINEAELWKEYEKKRGQNAFWFPNITDPNN